MGKTKSVGKDAVKAAKSSKPTEVKGISSVKSGAVTKPSQTHKSQSKEIAKQVAAKADKKSKKVKKEPTPVSSSDESESASGSRSESDSETDAASASGDDSEIEAPVPVKAEANGKLNGASKPAKPVDERSESSESNGLCRAE